MNRRLERVAAALVLVGVAILVLCAAMCAAGARINQLPLTAERVKAAMKKG